MNFKYILEKWNIKADINVLLGIWNESNRYYHNLDHLNYLIEKINNDIDVLNEKEYDKLILTALFHDIVYDVASTVNEEKSAEFFISVCENKNDKDIREIYDAIIATKSHNGVGLLSERFNKYDMSIVESDIDNLLEWEDGIYNEYKIFGDDKYKDGRVKFLESLLDKYPLNSGNLIQLIEVVKSKY